MDTRDLASTGMFALEAASVDIQKLTDVVASFQVS